MNSIAMGLQLRYHIAWQDCHTDDHLHSSSPRLLDHEFVLLGKLSLLTVPKSKLKQMYQVKIQG